MCVTYTRFPYPFCTPECRSKAQKPSILVRNRVIRTTTSSHLHRCYISRCCLCIRIAEQLDGGIDVLYASDVSVEVVCSPRDAIITTSLITRPTLSTPRYLYCHFPWQRETNTPAAPALACARK